MSCGLCVVSIQAKTLLCRSLVLHFFEISGPLEEGVSSFYICFVSFIAVGLILMTVVVIVTSLKRNSKGHYSSNLYSFITSFCFGLASALDVSSARSIPSPSIAVRANRITLKCFYNTEPTTGTTNNDYEDA